MNYKTHLLLSLILLILISGCKRNPDWSRKYNIKTQKEGDTVISISDYPCILDSDCKEFCYDFGSQGVISYRYSCRQNVCVCSASRFAD
jgi:hypothetical protein